MRQLHFQSITYDNAGRVQSVTDSEGYTVTTAYDNLDRPVSITYPGTPTSADTKTDLTFYNKLDVWKTTDRQNRSTYNYYDAIHLVPRLRLGTHLLRPFHGRSQRKTKLFSVHHLVKKSNCIAVELNIWMFLLIKGLSLSIGVNKQTELHRYG